MHITFIAWYRHLNKKWRDLISFIIIKYEISRIPTSNFDKPSEIYMTSCDKKIPITEIIEGKVTIIISL
jgi:hypothetical protein